MDDQIEGNLPFNISHHDRTAESIGTKVLLPDDSSSTQKVYKIGKNEMSDITKLVKETQDMRNREEVAVDSLPKDGVDLIEPQDYVIVEGTQKGQARMARVQSYVEGVPLKKIGMKGLLHLKKQEYGDLKQLLAGSIRCFLTKGTNYDLFGSDIEDVSGKSPLDVVRKLVFPLRNSNNLFLTKDGIKLVDPNVLGKPNQIRTRPFLIQSVLFTSSLVDYAVVSVLEQFAPEKDNGPIAEQTISHSEMPVS